MRADGSTRVSTVKADSIIAPCATADDSWPIWRAFGTADPNPILAPADPNQLPSDYNGWLQYTSLNSSMLDLVGGFDAFTSVMSVPDVPKRKARMLYFFPGLQNRGTHSRDTIAAIPCTRTRTRTRTHMYMLCRDSGAP